LLLALGIPARVVMMVAASAYQALLFTNKALRATGLQIIQLFLRRCWILALEFPSIAIMMPKVSRASEGFSQVSMTLGLSLS
jgi:hypothetical protein